MSEGLERSCSFQPRSQLRPDRGTLRISCERLHCWSRCLERGPPAQSRQQKARGQQKASAELLSQRLNDVEPCFGSWLFLYLQVFIPGADASPTQAQTPLTQTELGDRQISHPFAGCSKNGIAQRRYKRRHPRLADTCRWRIAIDDVYVRLSGNLINSRYRIVLKI